jgi:hypothetical protein
VTEPLEILVATDHQFTTPDGSVGAETGAVEGDPDDRTLAVEAVLRHHRADVCVMVLDLGDRVVAACCPMGGPVPGVTIGDHLLGLDPGEHLHVRGGVRERLQRPQIVHVADVLAHPGVPAVGQAAGVLQVRADGEGGRDRLGQRERERGVAA